MRRILNQAKRALAGALRRAADKLEPPTPIAAYAAPPGDGPEVAKAKRMAAELHAVRAGAFLKVALRRFHPNEPTAEA